MIAEDMTSCTVAGAILAGGNAQRIGGISKGTLRVDADVSIVERLIRELRSAGMSEVVIIANNRKPYLDYGVEIIGDIRTGIGPMGGVESGLVHLAGRSDAVMFVPCDLPNITAGELLTLKNSFAGSRAPAVFAKTSEFSWHPLCAVADIGLAGAVSGAIDRGERKIRNVWKQVGAVGVRLPDENAFFNINSGADMEKWRRAKSLSA